MDEARQRILESDSSDSETDSECKTDSESNVEIQMKKWRAIIDSFEGGEGFNSEMFRENAKLAILPILCQSLRSDICSENDTSGM